MPVVGQLIIAAGVSGYYQGCVSTHYRCGGVGFAWLRRAVCRLGDYRPRKESTVPPACIAQVKVLQAAGAYLSAWQTQVASLCSTLYSAQTV